MCNSNKQQIPKVINYCWFGGKPKPESVIKCIESWRVNCPDFQIKEWNETNYDIHKHPYMQKAYEDGKWAFVSDYARHDIMYLNGGIYLDTDVEVLKDLSPLCDFKAFIGFECDEKINDGQGFGCMPKMPIFKEWLDCYEGDAPYELIDGNKTNIESPRICTDLLLKYGLKLNGQRQRVGDIEILPVEYLCPKDYFSGRLKITENTYSIHHFDGSWHGKNALVYQRFMQTLVRIFGNKRGLEIYTGLMEFKDEIKKRFNKKNI